MLTLLAGVESFRKRAFSIAATNKTGFFLGEFLWFIKLYTE